MPLQLVQDLPEEVRETKACMICGKKDNNELLFGKFYTNDGLTAHYYCLLFSSGLEQKGKDDEGILGFLRQDIEKECKRGSKLHCSKCRKHGATVGCCEKACKKTYHFPCGAESRMLNQYFGAFNSYCTKHQPIQEVKAEILIRSSPGGSGKATCTICHDEVVAKPSYDVLWAPCCQKQSWFHRQCMQKLALSAGYFFKCPMCSDNGLFLTEMKRMGIYVPEQDASWELEPNAFQELIQRHSKCDHPNCICPKGRTHDGDGTRWELMLCASCGSKGLHIGCGRLEWNITEWDCDDCSKLARGGQRANANQETPNDNTNPARRSLTFPPSVSAAPAAATSNGGHQVVNVSPARRLNTISRTASGAIKRPHDDDQSGSSSSGSSEDSEVDITSVSDADSSSAKSLRYDSNPSPIPQTSRNVARRGGRGGPSWAARGPTASKPLRSVGAHQYGNLENLRFKVSKDSKEILVIIDQNDPSSPAKTYTIPVDQPTISPRRRK